MEARSDRQFLPRSATTARGTAHVRRAAAVFALTGSALLITLAAAGPFPPFGYALLAAGLAASIFWWRSSTRLYEQSRRDRGTAGVTLEPGKLHLADDTASPHKDSQRTLTMHTKIWVDEERLEVVIDDDVAPALRISPEYGGLGVYELAETIQTFRILQDGALQNDSSENGSGA